MSEFNETAADCWEIEQEAGGQIFKPVYMVILRDKKQPSRSVVKATSSDFQSVNRYAQQLQEDLYLLSNEEFVKKYVLSSIS
jgi:hypothetical protein